MSLDVTVSVPASSANLGPGFDCLAAALPLRLVVRVIGRSGPFDVCVTGEGAGTLPTDATNLIAATMLDGGNGDGLAMQVENGLPLASGCGSSAAAIVAGLALRDAIAGRPFDPARLLVDATAVEHHPDNLAAAIYGGITLASNDPVVARRIDPPDDLAFVLVIPAEQLATTRARAALPAEVRREHAVYNVQRTAFLVHGLLSSDFESIRLGLGDRLHQDQRVHLTPTYASLRGRLAAVGAFGVTLSGAGPSILLWCRAADADAVASRTLAIVPGARVTAMRPELRGLVLAA